MTIKSREKKVRRQLAKNGYRLVKSRIKNPELWSLFGYMIVEIQSNFIVTGTDANKMSLEEVEDWIKSE